MCIRDSHASVLSPQFQDLLKNGENSRYKDFFINWNRFWEGHGKMTEEGYIQPDEEKIKDMFFRKPGLPILMVRMPDGSEVPYWNTFYQEVRYQMCIRDRTRVVCLDWLMMFSFCIPFTYFNRKMRFRVI